MGVGNMQKEIKSLLIDLGCPKSIYVRGLVGLMADWGNFVNLLTSGETFSLDYYLNRLDGRLIVFVLELQLKSEEQSKLQKYSQRLHDADSSFKSALETSTHRIDTQLPDSLGWLCNGIPAFVHDDRVPSWIRALELVALPSEQTKRSN